MNKPTFKDYKITRELSCSNLLSIQSKNLLAYLIMTKKRVLFANAKYLASVFNASVQSIGNWLMELEEKDFITRYKREGKRYYLTIVHDYAYIEFNYDLQKISNNWNYIEKDINYNKLKQKALANYGVDVLALYKELYGRR